MKISICFYSTIYSTGFKSQQLSLLIKKLEENNISYSTYSFEYSNKKIYSKNKTATISFIPLLPTWIFEKLLKNLYPSFYNYLLGEILYYYIFRDAILKDNADIILVKNRPSKLLSYIKNNSNKKIILEVDQQHPLFTKSILNKLNKPLLNSKPTIYLNNYAINDYIKSFQLADLIVVYTNKQKDILIEYGVKKEIVINELGLENSEIAPPKTNQQLESGIAFVCFANHSILKGTHLLIDVWRKYSIKNKLFIVGSQEIDFKNYIKSLNSFNLNNIFFIEKFNKVDLQMLSNDYNLVGVLLSYSESYARVVSEYFQNNMPVIISKIIDRKVRELGIGILVDNQNLEEIKNAIDYMSDKSNYLDFQKNIINTKFRTQDDFSNTYIKIFNSIEI